MLTSDPIGHAMLALTFYCITVVSSFVRLMVVYLWLRVKEVIVPLCRLFCSLGSVLDFDDLDIRLCFDLHASASPRWRRESSSSVLHSAFQ